MEYFSTNVNEKVGTINKFLPDISLHDGDGPVAMLLGTQAGLGWLPRLALFWVSRSDKQRYLMPEGINARVSRYYIC